jgi:SAM-dependent methyltransferase
MNSRDYRITPSAAGSVERRRRDTLDTTGTASSILPATTSFMTEETGALEARKLEEIAFHDKLRTGQHQQRWSPEAEAKVKDDPLWSNFKYYSIEEDSLALMRQWVGERTTGATILDYCCGNGDEALVAAQNGARHVVGIDISPISIANCRARARAEGLHGVVDFEVMDAEALKFPDRHFDLIMEYGVLHHLDLDKAMAELARVMKTDGAMVCTETLGHNPLIRWYRQRTPDLRTAWEAQHILTKSSFDIMRRHFGGVEMRFFHLASIAAVPLRHTSVFRPVLGVLRTLDNVLLRIPVVRWQAWQVVFRLSKPRAARG